MKQTIIWKTLRGVNIHYACIGRRDNGWLRLPWHAMCESPRVGIILARVHVGSQSYRVSIYQWHVIPWRIYNHIVGGEPHSHVWRPMAGPYHWTRLSIYEGTKHITVQYNNLSLTFRECPSLNPKASDITTSPKQHITLNIYSRPNKSASKSWPLKASSSHRYNTSDGIHSLISISLVKWKPRHHQVTVAADWCLAGEWSGLRYINVLFIWALFNYIRFIGTSKKHDSLTFNNTTEHRNQPQDRMKARTLVLLAAFSSLVSAAAITHLYGFVECDCHQNKLFRVLIFLYKKEQTNASVVLGACKSMEKWCHHLIRFIPPMEKVVVRTYGTSGFLPGGWCVSTGRLGCVSRWLWCLYDLVFIPQSWQCLSVSADMTECKYSPVASQIFQAIDSRTELLPVRRQYCLQ